MLRAIGRAWKVSRFGDILLLRMELLDTIGSPEDLKKLDEKNLRPLAEQIRRRIISTVRRNGGHLASNLGVIELTIALHRVFDSPRDALVWDVGHQSYAHKLLTGRGPLFDKIRKKDGISGFPKRSESPHDIFDTGHSSTSLSSALGLLEGWKRTGREGRAVAVIGDGALTGGLAFEALSNVGQLGLPLIVVLNDNKMSISRNVGALSRYLSRLSASMRYQSLRSLIDRVVISIPLVGGRLMDLVQRSKRAVKAIFYKDNFFSDLGFEYVGPIDGHNIPLLIGVFEQVKRLNRPVVVHVMTTKGKGDEKAEEDPESFHGVAPFCVDTAQKRPSFTEAFGSAILKASETDPRICAVTAAMAKGTGLDPLAKRHPARVYDVGIAEQHAVTFAAGLATGGLKPVVALYSTFIQRAVDQVAHDVALPDLPVVFAVDRAGAVGEDGETHQGLYDIPLLKSIPHMAILAPSDPVEMELFLDYALSRSGPTVLRYPKARVECSDPASAEPLEEGRGLLVRKRRGARALVCALGPFASTAARVSDALASEGVLLDVYSLRFAAPLDAAHFLELVSGYRRIAVYEDGAISGGVGESLAALLAGAPGSISVELHGFDSTPRAQASREELLSEAGLDEPGLTSSLRALAARADDDRGEGRTREAQREALVAPAL